MIEHSEAVSGLNRRVGYLTHPLGVLERGTIVRANDSFVFVEYDDSPTPKATRANDLYWLDDIEPGVMCDPCLRGEHQWHMPTWMRIVETQEHRVGRKKMFYRCPCDEDGHRNE